MPKYLIFIIAAILLLYGLRSVVAGIRKEKRNYWINIHYDGLRKALKENYDQVYNIFWGIIAIIFGLILIYHLITVF